MKNELNIGDLIKVKNKNTIKRHLISNDVFTHNSEKIISDVRFGGSDIGVITNKKKIRRCEYYQVLAPEGIGWIYHKIVEMV